MFLSKRNMIMVYVILPLVSYFGSHHGLMNAEAKETPNISAAIITASLKSTPSKIMTTTGLKQEDGSETVGNFDTEAIFTMSQMSTVKTQTLEMANTSSKDSRLPWVVFSARSVLAITSYICSSSTLETTSSITVSLRPVGGINHPIEPSRAVSPSQYLLSSLLSNSTVNPHGGRQVDVKDDCSTDACDTYVTRWVDFYLNVGGWIMLSVVLVGITVLTVTYIHGRKTRKEIKGLPQLMYREMFRYAGDRWV